MKRLTLLALTGLLVALALPVAAHDFTFKGDDRTVDAQDNHVCSGTKDWTATGGVSSFRPTFQGLSTALYAHHGEHGEPETQDPEVAGVRLPGIVWLETNGLEGLQKNDFVCRGKGEGQDSHEPQIHGDTAIL